MENNMEYNKLKTNEVDRNGVNKFRSIMRVMRVHIMKMNSMRN